MIPFVIKFSFFKYSSLITLFLLCNISLGQEFHNFNNQNSISDSLEFENEIRIYKVGNYQTNCTELVRIYENKRDWQIDYFKCNKKLTLLINSQRIFYKILQNHPFHIPDQKDIEWKLKKIIGLEKNIEGNYQILVEKKLLPDHGYSYFFFVNRHGQYNQFKYYCPEILLQNYPEVDELILVNNILNVIKLNLNIWDTENIK